MKKFLAAILSMLMVLALTACGGSSSSTASVVEGDPNDPTVGESYTIRIATNQTAADVAGEGISQTGKGLIWFGQQIEERTGGRIKLQIFTDGQLASSTQEYIGNALSPYNRELCIYDYQPENGKYSVPDLPGIGNELSEVAFRNCDKVTIE